MLPPEFNAALASLAQRDQLRRTRIGARKSVVGTPDASASQKGAVELADDGEDAPNVAVQGNDYRLPVIVKKTSDQATSSVSPIDDHDLLFSLQANRIYHFRFTCVMRSGSDSVGFRLALAFPPSLSFAAVAKSLVDNTSTAESQAALLDSGNVVTFPGIPNDGVDYIGTIEGAVSTTGSGLLKLQFGSETGGANVTMRRGSVGFLYDLGV